RAQRHVPSNDAVAAPIVATYIRQMHRPTFPFTYTGGLAEQFRHQRIRVRPDGQCMGVIPIGGDDMILGAASANGANGHCFLTNVKVQKAAYLAELVEFGTFLFKSTNQYHLPVPVEKRRFFHSVLL